jgi:hypothetical protein
MIPPGVNSRSTNNITPFPKLQSTRRSHVFSFHTLSFLQAWAKMLVVESIMMTPFLHQEMNK